MEINRKDPSSNKSGVPMRGMALWLLLLALFLTVFQMFSQQQERHQKLAYSDFAQLVREGKVRKCEIVNEASGLQYFVRGELVDMDTRTGRPKKFKVDVLSLENLQNMLDENKVYYFDQISESDPLAGDLERHSVSAGPRACCTFCLSARCVWRVAAP